MYDSIIWLLIIGVVVAIIACLDTASDEDDKWGLDDAN